MAVILFVLWLVGFALGRGEGVPLARIADAVGTPAYVYSRASIEAAYQAEAERTGVSASRSGVPVASATVNAGTTTAAP